MIEFAVRCRRLKSSKRGRGTTTDNFRHSSWTGQIPNIVRSHLVSRSPIATDLISIWILDGGVLQKIFDDHQRR